MSKKVLTGAMAAVMATGMVPVTAMAQTTDLGQLYSDTFKAVMAAKEAGTQVSINAARALLAQYKAEIVAQGKDGLLTQVNTLSVILDGVQQPLFSKIVKAIMKMQETGKATQAEINEVRTLIEGKQDVTGDEILVESFIKTWSADVDVFQAKLIDAATVAVKDAEAKGTQEAVDAAKVLVAELATAVRAGVKTIATGLQTRVDAVVVTGKVESVVAINLTQMVVTFNKAVDKETATDKANYTFNKTALNANDKVELSEDGKHVTITLVTQESNQSSRELTIKNVKDLNGKAVENFAGNVKFEDFAVPTVTKVVSAGPDSFKVVFSEPVRETEAENTANYSVDNGKYFIQSAERVSLNEVIVKLYSTLADGEYSIGVKNVVDLAGYKVADTTLKLTQTKDAVAPTVTKVVSASPLEVVLEMSEDVKLNGTVAEVVNKISHTNSTMKASNVEVDGKKVTISFASANSLPNGTAYLTIAKEAFVDGWGNKTAEYKSAIQVTADTVKPTVEKAEALADNKLQITFSEKVNETLAETSANYTILDKDGKKVDVTITATLDTAKTNKVVTLDLSKVLYGGNYTVVVEKVKDLTGNEMDKATANVVVKDTTAPTVTTTGTYYADKKIVKVSFNEPMATNGVGSVLDLGNYSIGGKYLSATKATVSAIDGGKAVLIDLTAAIEAGQLNAPTGITVGKVADISGNFSSVSTDVTLSAPTTIDIDRVEATGTKTVKVYLEDALAKFNAADFTLKLGNSAITPASVVFNNVDGKGVITYTLTDAQVLGTNGKKGSDAITVSVKDNATSANAFGQIVTAGTSKEAIDKIVATVVEFDHDSDSSTDKVQNVQLFFTDIDKDGKVDKNESATIEIVYSEKLDSNTLSTMTYSVDGFKVTGITQSTDGVVTLTVAALEDNTTSKPVVNQVANIADDNGVVIVSGAKLSVAKSNVTNP